MQQAGFELAISQYPVQECNHYTRRNPTIPVVAKCFYPQALSPPKGFNKKRSARFEKGQEIAQKGSVKMGQIHV